MRQSSKCDYTPRSQSSGDFRPENDLPQAQTTGPIFYPMMVPPMLMPLSTLYGQLQVNAANGSTVIFTSAPIPPNTTSIVLVPVLVPNPAMNAPASQTPNVSVFRSGSSVSSEASSVNQPVAVFIERNAFKQWFDGNAPAVLQELPLRIKRYKSVETFMHWLCSKKKYDSIELAILIRVTEVPRLLREVKNLKNLRIFAYEHLLDPSQQPGKSARNLVSEAESTRKDFDPQRLVVCTCLAQACGKLLAFHQQKLVS